MEVEEFLNHLYKNVWIYIIRQRNFDEYWKTDEDRNYDPGDFYSDNIPELLKNLKEGFALHKSYQNVVGRIDLKIRPVIMDFMVWVSMMGELTANDIYNVIYSGRNLNLKPLSNLVKIVETTEMPIILEKQGTREKLGIIFTVIDKFTSASTSLTNRRKNKTSIDIVDEYDVQDILHVILKPFFPTIKSEQVVSGNDDEKFLKIDFLIASEKAAIECKFIRDNNHATSITKEINDDIQTYAKHQDCNNLIFFIYDKDMHISNPDVLEDNYTIKQSFNDKSINVFLKIRPKN